MLANKSLSLVVGLVLTSAAGAQFVVGPPGAAKPWLRGLYVMTLTGTASGIDEHFLFYTPGTGAARKPVVVGFHGFSVSPLQFTAGASEVINQANQRDWYAICPMGTYDNNMGVWHTQTNVEEVLQWVDDHYPLNHNRVYGIGFSMGGGWMMSYAARHVDPTRLMFAAVVNHTGTMSLTYAHATGSASTLELPELFGTDPSGDLFGYLRSQSIDIDSSGLIVNQTNDMARNLTHLHVYNFYSDNDTLTTSGPLKISVDRFQEQLQQRMQQAGGAAVGSTQLVVGPVMGGVPPHHWTTLDIPTACALA